MSMADRKRARELATEFINRGDPTGWFEALYKEGQEGKSIVPWADGVPSPFLLQFWARHPQETAGKTALVVGSGHGDDAEQLAFWGFRTTAFDVAETAIRISRARFPQSSVTYSVANLFEPPAAWRDGFDFVFETNTVQALPVNLRSRAIAQIASFVGRGGKLLVIARGRQLHEPQGDMPWPLTHDELNEFVRAGLVQESFEEFFDQEDPPARRFRGFYRKPQPE
jgi:Methyltransferase domain